MLHARTLFLSYTHSLDSDWPVAHIRHVYPSSNHTITTLSRTPSVLLQSLHTAMEGVDVSPQFACKPSFLYCAPHFFPSTDTV